MPDKPSRTSPQRRFSIGSAVTVAPETEIQVLIQSGFEANHLTNFLTPPPEFYAELGTRNFILLANGDLTFNKKQANEITLGGPLRDRIKTPTMTWETRSPG